MGKFTEEGALVITGRIKEQYVCSCWKWVCKNALFICFERYKLQNGKFVVPSQLEAAIGRSRFIEQCLVHGENLPGNVAIIVPNWPNVSASIFFFSFFYPFPGAWSSRSSRFCVSRRTFQWSLGAQTFAGRGVAWVCGAETLRDSAQNHCFSNKLYRWKRHGNAENVPQTQKHRSHFSKQNKRNKVLS